MAIFPLNGVLARVSGCGVQEVRLSKNPCAALFSEKIAHF
jgi:hypothetical protein